MKKMYNDNLRNTRVQKIQLKIVNYISMILGAFTKYHDLIMHQYLLITKITTVTKNTILKSLPGKPRKS